MANPSETAGVHSGLRVPNTDHHLHGLHGIVSPKEAHQNDLLLGDGVCSRIRISTGIHCLHRGLSIRHALDAGPDI